MIELLTADEVGAIFKVPRSTIDTWVARKKIPESVMFKLEGKRSPRRFIRSKLEAWIDGSLQT